MTLPDERTRAVWNTRQFLYDLLSRKYKRVPKEVREQAYRCLRHYPGSIELIRSWESIPDIFGPCESVESYVYEGRKNGKSRKK